MVLLFLQDFEIQQFCNYVSTTSMTNLRLIGVLIIIGFILAENVGKALVELYYRKFVSLKFKNGLLVGRGHRQFEMSYTQGCQMVVIKRAVHTSLRIELLLDSIDSLLFEHLSINHLKIV